MSDLANLVVLILFVITVAGGAARLGRALDRRLFRAGKPVVKIRTYGNTATEDWARWFHVEVCCDTDVVAARPRVTVLVREGRVGHERWRFAEDREWIGRDPLLVPIVVGSLETSSARPLSGVAPVWFLDPTSWYLTPDAKHVLGRFLGRFVVGQSYDFEVRVTWVEDGKQAHKGAAFRLAFTERGPTFQSI